MVFRLIVRAERRWSTLAAVIKITAVMALLAILYVVAVTPALAANSEPNPFRWGTEPSA